jgi:hypothetical protein
VAGGPWIGEDRRVARLVAALTAVVALAAVAFRLADPVTRDDAAQVAALPLFLAAVLVPTGVGLFVALRRPGNRVAWILLFGPLSVAVLLCADAVAPVALHHHPGSAVGAWAATLSAPWPVLFLWPLALAFAFPDGVLPSARWRPVATCVGLNSALIVVLLVGADDHDGPYGKVPSPLPVGFGDWAVPLFWVSWAGLLVSLCAGAAALIARYRAGDAQRRRQVLWLAYGALLLPLWLGGGSILARLVGWSDAVDFGGLMILQAWPAVAVAVAVTRHGLYAIDRLLNRTLVYAALTVLLH